MDFNVQFVLLWNANREWIFNPSYFTSPLKYDYVDF